MTQSQIGLGSGYPVCSDSSIFLKAAQGFKGSMRKKTIGGIMVVTQVFELLLQKIAIQTMAAFL